jgi:SAM-dependent methyltransferase
MMYGTREEFEYCQCGACGCLQIADVPPDLGRYYSSGYYSVKPQGRMKKWLAEERLSYLITNRGVVGRAVAWIRPPEAEPDGDPDAPPIPTGARVLEVGCGNGYFLHKLVEFGYRDLHGIDPFMDPAYVTDRPVRLERRSILELDPHSDGPYDCIMFGHSLEHIAEHAESLDRARELLAPGGLCILGLPWADSYAWETYREDWVQLDAPRHLYLHTARSLAVLAASTGLEVTHLSYDSTSFQFWGSEQYRRGIPLRDPRSWSVDPAQSIFSPDQIDEFERRAAELNAERRGDQVRAYLTVRPCG